MTRTIADDLVIVLAGEAGQGIQSIESILAQLLKMSGYNFFSASEFMSRVRGGANSTEIRVSSKRVTGFLERIDILIPLHKESILHLKKRITPGYDRDRGKGKNRSRRHDRYPVHQDGDGNRQRRLCQHGCRGVNLRTAEESMKKNARTSYWNISPGKAKRSGSKNLAAIKKGYAAGKGLAEIILP